MSTNEDLFFETEFRNRIRNHLISVSKQTNLRISDEYSNPFNPNYETELDFMGCEKVSYETELVLKDIDSVIEFYYSDKNPEDTTTNFYEQYSIPFKEQFTDKKLYEAFENTELSEEEACYLYAATYNCRMHKTNFSPKQAFTTILLKRKLDQQFGKEAYADFLEIIKNNSHLKKDLAYFSKLFSDKPFGEDVITKYNDLIESQTDKTYYNRFNCGGYALRIDAPIFPPIRCNQYQAVSKILDTYDFVRLLGDTPLQDDEYLVFYRNNGKHGHHFIRVDSDGTVREKDGNGIPKVFENWNEIYNNSDQATFAVKKNHEMFNHVISNFTPGPGLDFEGAAGKCACAQESTFSYHGKTYTIKKDDLGAALVYSDDGTMVAEAIIDEDDYFIDVLDGKKEFVENISGFVKPIIRDGKLVNLEEFKGGKTIKQEKNHDDDGFDR